MGGSLLDDASLLAYGVLALFAVGFWLWVLGSSLLGIPSPGDAVRERGDDRGGEE